MYLFQASGYRQLRYMKGYGIWLFGVKGNKMANKCISSLWKKKEITFWFCNALMFKRRCVYSS